MLQCPVQNPCWTTPHVCVCVCVPHSLSLSPRAFLPTSMQCMPLMFLIRRQRRRDNAPPLLPLSPQRNESEAEGSRGLSFVCRMLFTWCIWHGNLLGGGGESVGRRSTKTRTALAHSNVCPSDRPPKLLETTENRPNVVSNATHFRHSALTM